VSYAAHVLLTIVPFVAMVALSLAGVAASVVGLLVFDGHGDFAAAAEKYGWALRGRVAVTLSVSGSDR
jgi:hypothetical protein